MRKLDKSEHFDLVYTRYPPSALLEGFILKLMGKKWVADIWDHPEMHLEVARQSSDFKNTVMQSVGVFLGHRILKRADKVICGLLPDAIRNYNVPEHKLLYVTHGVDTEYVRPRKESYHDIRRQFQLLYVGPVHKIRSVDIMLKAMETIHREIPHARLVLAGKIHKEFKGWLNEFIESRGMQDVVQPLGRISYSEVLQLIEQSDVCLCPLSDTKVKRYNYPIKIYEYLALEKPVVATNLPAIASIIRHGENGLLVEPNDPDSMANMVLDLYQNVELQKKLASNARKSIMEYEWEKIDDRINAALESLA